jgi:hypothetical protein
VQHELSAEEARLTYLLFPHLGSLELDQVEDLGDLVRLVARTRTSPVTCPAVLEQAAAEQAPDPQRTAGQATAEHAGNRARVLRTRQRYEQVQKLKAEGMRIAAIQRELRLAPGTARRYFHAATVDELVAGTLAGWPSMLDDYKPYLHQRWNEGCTNIWQLHNEVKALGFRGSYGTVYAYLRPFKGKPAPPAVPAPSKVRHITSWIRRRSDNLDAGEQLKLNEILAACPHLDALRGHVEEFAKMITGLRGDRLDAWIAAVRADDLPPPARLRQRPRT